MQRSTFLTLCLSIGFAWIGAIQAIGEEKSAGQLRHVVLFKFKESVTKDQVAEVVAAFGALPGKIDTIRGFEWGTDVSTEMKADGFTHCFVVTFADVTGRDEYLPHPEHKKFGELLGQLGVLEDAFVVDYVPGQ